MNEYHKIDSLYERDMEGTKKLIIGKYRSVLVEYLKDNVWIWTEKIDGTNIRIHWDGHKVSFAGRTDKAQIPDLLTEKLISLFGGRETEELFEQKFGEKPVTLYGEGFGSKINSGGDYTPTQDFVLFDVCIENIWLERANVEDIAKAFGIKVVPVILHGTIGEAVDIVKASPNSLLALHPKVIEGLVGTPAVRIKDALGKRVIVKIKAEDFV